MARAHADGQQPIPSRMRWPAGAGVGWWRRRRWRRTWATWCCACCTARPASSAGGLRRAGPLRRHHRGHARAGIPPPPGLRTRPAARRAGPALPAARRRACSCWSTCAAPGATPTPSPGGLLRTTGVSVLDGGAFGPSVAGFRAAGLRGQRGAAGRGLPAHPRHRGIARRAARLNAAASAAFRRAGAGWGLAELAFSPADHPPTGSGRPPRRLGRGHAHRRNQRVALASLRHETTGAR